MYICTDGDASVSVAYVNSPMTDGNLTLAESNLKILDENQYSSVEPTYYNSHYLKPQSFLKETPAQTYAEVGVGASTVDDVARDYQNLNTTTMAYVNLYSTPVKGKDGVVVPRIEVGGNIYAAVDTRKTEKHIYTSLAK